MNGWTFATNEDCWENLSDLYPTKSDAIRAGKEYYESDDLECFVVGFAKKMVLDKDIIKVNRVLEDINYDVLESMVGYENSNYLLDLSDKKVKELSDALNLVFHGWINKYNLEPNYYNIDNIKVIELKESEENYDDT